MKLSLRRVLLLSALFPMMGLLGGCAGEAGGITLTSMKSKQAFTQGFSDAYVARNDHGDLDVLLVDDAAARVLAGSAPTTTVRQIMHLRVLWEPERDAKTNDQCTSNASIHWYVLSPGGAMEYRGTGFVSTQTFSGLIRVSVKNADMRPVVQVAGLKDPVGPARLEGSVFAQSNPRAVRELLAEVHNSVAIASGEGHGDAVGQ